MNLIKYLPNAVTCLNLFAGCAGVWLGFQGNYAGAMVAILFSATFDFLDGFLARLLHAYSDIGKELDSLADVVSFGVVPGAIAFSLLSSDAVHSYSFVAFFIPVFSALRLAKFNLDERQEASFLGLPTPANALFWGGLSISVSDWLIQYPVLLSCLIILFSFLMLFELPMFSLKFKNLKWKENQLQFIFLVVSLILILWLQLDAIFIIIVWYILLSLFDFLMQKVKSL